MADTLKASLLDADRRGAVVADLQDFVDKEVAGKGGLSGGVIKTGYAAVKRVKPGIIRSAIDSMLDDFVDALEPYWTALPVRSPCPASAPSWPAGRRRSRSRCSR